MVCKAIITQKSKKVNIGNKIVIKFLALEKYKRLTIMGKKCIIKIDKL